MVTRISDEDLERIRDANPIEAVIGEYVALRPAGGGNFTGACPFHDPEIALVNDRVFNVRPARRAFYCFGCQVGGDVFDFVGRIQHFDLVETAIKLAHRRGIRFTFLDEEP